VFTFAHLYVLVLRNGLLSSEELLSIRLAKHHLKITNRTLNDQVSIEINFLQTTAVQCLLPVQLRLMSLANQSLLAQATQKPRS
jgi:hypothetical protein